MYREILVTLDGSELAEGALPHAIALQKAFSARLTLLLVLEPSVAYVQPALGGMVVDATIVVDEEVHTGRDYLDGITSRLSGEGMSVQGVIRDGDPASEICDYAAENEIDMIVMCTHGRSGIKRWVYGSVADKVLRSASTPVLLIRAATEEPSSCS